MSERDPRIDEVKRQLASAVAARKCWPCGCFHSSLEAIERSALSSGRPHDLTDVLKASRDVLQEIQYDCLGCEVCYPASAVNDFGVEAITCPSEPVEERKGWPPYAGDCTVLKYNAPVAVCTLTDDALAHSLVDAHTAGLSVVGTLQTENLGIERIILNTLANPNIRFLVVCGPDSRQTVGHLPGQSLVSLAENGVDDRMHIKGAEGKRPHLQNLPAAAVEHFRNTIKVIDFIGVCDVSLIQAVVGECELQNPGPAASFASFHQVECERGYLPSRLTPDPAGYFVLYVDQRRSVLSLEHFSNNGVLDMIIEGTSAAEVYTTSIDKQLLTRLDHAAYLGRELARAEHALHSKERYMQDAAPEQSESTVQSGCGCQTLKQETVS